MRRVLKKAKEQVISTATWQQIFTKQVTQVLVFLGKLISGVKGLPGFSV